MKVCLALFLLASLPHPSIGNCGELAGDRVSVSGLITPLDGSGFYLRNAEGQSEVRFDKGLRVALEANYRQLGDLADGVLRYRVHSSEQSIEFVLPPGPHSAERPLRGGVEAGLQAAEREGWLSARGLRVFCGEVLGGSLPSEADPRFVGRFTFAAGRDAPASLAVGGREFEVSMKKGGQTDVLLFNLLETKDCHPFVNRATAIGREVDGVLVADEIHLLPIGDQAADDDPDLPRYLFIGDSISGNYSSGLRAALEGKANLHHPPTNCGPSSKGAANIVEWLGAFEEPGRGWDVISFNFGHWDASSSKASYQANLERVIAELEKTGAKLIWVTTCPVPKGNPAAGGLDESGRAPGRTAGVMHRYLNPWASEVVARHPEISVCDQWGFVQRHRGDLFKEWWAGDNVHFGGDGADALGGFLAEEVMRVLGLK